MNKMAKMNLFALGVDPDTLPELKPCACAENAVIQLDFGIIDSKWGVWCSCGNGTFGHATALGAVETWNAQTTPVYGPNQLLIEHAHG